MNSVIKKKSNFWKIKGTFLFFVIFTYKRNVNCVLQHFSDVKVLSFNESSSLNFLQVREHARRTRFNTTIDSNVAFNTAITLGRRKFIITFNPYHAECLKWNNPSYIFGTFHYHFRDIKIRP